VQAARCAALVPGLDHRQCDPCVSARVDHLAALRRRNRHRLSTSTGLPCWAAATVCAQWADWGEVMITAEMSALLTSASPDGSSSTP
jgi:hypothetical protein